MDTQSRLKKKNKSGEKGEANPKTSEQKDTEKKKSNDEEPEKTVSNESYGDGEPENYKNSTEASDNEEEKIHSKDSNGDATLKQDTKKTAGVGKELENIVTVMGQMIMTECLPLCRRGLLAYVYNGVSLTMNTIECVSGGKWLLYSTAQCP